MMCHGKIIYLPKITVMFKATLLGTVNISISMINYNIVFIINLPPGIDES